MTVREALEVAMKLTKSSGRPDPEEIKLIQDAIDKVESLEDVARDILSWPSLDDFAKSEEVVL